MARKDSPLGYIVALFDVMGFEHRLESYGLDEILRRYMSIVDFVNKNSEKNHIINNLLNMNSPLHLADGEPFIVYDVRAVYASDSILIWANLAWKMVQGLSVEVLQKNADHPAYGYFSHPIPLRPFFEICGEIICRGIENDLPLRGALAMGDAVFDEPNKIFLGKPIVEAARMENKQTCIGVTLCNSYQKQLDHNIFFLPYSDHLKKDSLSAITNKYAFNWPYYWRISRKSDCKDIIQDMAKKNNNHYYYKNTIDFISYSETYDYNKI